MPSKAFFWMLNKTGFCTLDGFGHLFGDAAGRSFGFVRATQQLLFEPHIFLSGQIDLEHSDKLQGLPSVSLPPNNPLSAYN